MSGRVTILTDASICHETEAGGWATAILRQDPVWGKGKPELTSGMFKTGFGAQTELNELAAVANALTVAIKKDLLRTGDRVQVVVDSEAALEQLRALHTPSCAGSAPILETVIRLKQKMSIDIQFKKVKAHQPRSVRDSKPTDDWAVLNDLVDRAAKREMRQARRIVQEHLQKARDSVPGDTLFVGARSNDPLGILRGLWGYGLLERRHVMTTLEQLVTEERRRDLDGHARVCVKLGLVHGGGRTQESIRKEVQSSVGVSDVMEALARLVRSSEDLLHLRNRGRVIAGNVNLSACRRKAAQVAKRAGKTQMQFIDHSYAVEDYVPEIASSVMALMRDTSRESQQSVMNI